MKNVSKISAIHKGNVYLIISPMGDNFSWYYLLLDGIKKPIFEEKIGKEAFDLKDFGEILYSGWGQEPPVDIKQKIQKRFG